MNSRVMTLKMAQATQWMKDQAASGLNKKEWCRRNGINPGIFFYYQHELRERVLDDNPALEAQAREILADPQASFVELPMPTTNNAAVQEQTATVAPSLPDSNSSIQISHGEFCIAISGDVSEQTLTKVLRAVKHAG